MRMLRNLSFALLLPALACAAVQEAGLFASIAKASGTRID